MAIMQHERERRVWTNARSAALLAHAKPISSLQFSRDGAFVASASADRSVKVWSTAALLERDASAASAQSVASTASAVDDSSAGAPPATAVPLATPLATPRAALFGHEEGVNDASWSHDGCYLVSASDDKTARIWDVEYSKTLSTLGRTSSSTSAFNAHGIAVDTGESAAALSLLGGHGGDSDSHTGYVFSAQFNPQGSLVVTASFDETVRFWDVRTGRSVAALSAHHEPIVSARFSHDGTLLVTASYDGLARIWDVATRECLRTIVTDPSVPLAHAQFSPNSRYVLVGALNSTLRLYDYARERCVQTYTGHVSKRFCSVAAFGKPGAGDASAGASALLVCGSEDGRVCMWDVPSGRLVDELRDDLSAAAAAGDAAGSARTTQLQSPVIAADYHPHEPIVIASAGSTIRVWEQRELEPSESAVAASSVAATLAAP